MLRPFTTVAHWVYKRSTLTIEEIQRQKTVTKYTAILNLSSSMLLTASKPPNTTTTKFNMKVIEF